MMNNTQALPTTEAEMLVYVDSKIDVQALEAAIKQARADASAAQAKLQEARQALASCEASAPTDPETWAAQRRRLADALPIFERIATDRANALSAAQMALYDARKRVIAQVDQQARALASDASAYATQRIDQLRAEIASLQSGQFPEFDHASAVTLAVRLAESHFRQRLTIN